ncbi:uncharacterized protein LOC126678414 [Mercurialis annua]|uniref:uncharacterized protein LOC126678414 n=1 Tax=Mercurialis annua TaxID=3986 RepID=UPI00215FCE65|nr:uncharacterized protein LOC126678414 [Mercurialis annua]
MNLREFQSMKILIKIQKSNCRATTHTVLIVRAKTLGIDVQVEHNASVMNAVGVCGLQLYRYDIKVKQPSLESLSRYVSRDLPVVVLCAAPHFQNLGLIYLLIIYLKGIAWTKKTTEARDSFEEKHTKLASKTGRVNFSYRIDMKKLQIAYRHSV